LSGDFSESLLNTGVGTSDLYQSNPGNAEINSQIYLGNIALSSAGVLTVTTFQNLPPWPWWPADS
jgi:hypothetical protein